MKLKLFENMKLNNLSNFSNMFHSTLLQKVVVLRGGPKFVITIMIGQRTFAIEYLGFNGRPVRKVVGIPLEAGVWHHLAVQV